MISDNCGEQGQPNVVLLLVI